MKLWMRLSFIAVVILASLLLITYFVLIFQGKAIITKQLESVTHKKVSIGHFGLASPFRFEIKNLEVEGLAKVESIFISPSLLGFLTGNIALNEVKVIKPELTYERFSLSPGESSQSVIPSDKTIAPQKKKRPLPLVIKGIQIREGKFNFVDHTISEAGLRVTVKDIYVDLNNLYILPRSVIAKFKIQGTIPWQQGQQEGKIEVGGWLNLFKKEMKATVKVEGIDGIYLYPYYSQWINL